MALITENCPLVALIKSCCVSRKALVAAALDPAWVLLPLVPCPVCRTGWCGAALDVPAWKHSSSSASTPGGTLRWLWRQTNWNPDPPASFLIPLFLHLSCGGSTVWRCCFLGKGSNGKESHASTYQLRGFVSAANSCSWQALAFPLSKTCSHEWLWKLLLIANSCKLLCEQTLNES